MKYYSLSEVLSKGMLKKMNGEPYSESQARRFLVIGSGVANPLYFPDAKKTEGTFGPTWQFSERDIKSFNK